MRVCMCVCVCIQCMCMGEYVKLNTNLQVCDLCFNCGVSLTLLPPTKMIIKLWFFMSLPSKLSAKITFSGHCISQTI